jgi:hypothetical protein
VQQSKGALWRRIVAWVLAVLAFVAVVSAVDAVWLKRTLTDTDRFVATFDSLPQDQAVATALSVRVADGIVEAAGVESFVAETLPQEISFLSAPLTAGINDFARKTAYEVITSDQFSTVWGATLRVTHTAASAVLSGNDRALVAEGGVVAIDLDEAATIVIGRIEDAGVDLPDVGDQIELGQVVILESDQLALAQSVAQAVNAAGWFLPLIALLLIAGAIWVAPDRRRMTAIVGFGSAIALLGSLAMLRFTRNQILDGIDDELSRDAAAAIWEQTVDRLVQGTWALIVVALIAGFIAWMVGPSARAVTFSAWGRDTIDRWRRPANADPTGFSAFVVERKRTIQVVVVVLGLLFVVFGPPPSGLLVILTTVVVVLLVVGTEVIGGPSMGPEDAEADEPVDAHAGADE